MNLKICGSKDPENIKQIAGLNPDYMGFIFYEHSKRYVGDQFIMPALPGGVKKVGVFVNASAISIIDKVSLHKLDLVQLHGNEKPDFCEVLNHIIPVVKAFGVDSSFDMRQLNAYKSSCTFFLFDTKTDGYGGSGTSFDWSLLSTYDNALPYFLSGGIGLEEMKRIRALKFNVHAIDVNSRFEAEPGIKDLEKLKQLKHELSS